MTITSHHNQKLKEVRKLGQRRRWRERAGRFVAEGEDVLAAADAAGWEPVERYCTAGSGLPGTEVDAELLAAASGLGSGTRALAVYEERWAQEALGPTCVYLHGLHDPGNVGTILRSAAAFGVSSVVLGPDTADPFSPKAVRASMGAVFGVPLVRAGLDARAAAGGGDRSRGVPGGDLDALPGVKIALVPGEGVPLSEVWTNRATPRHKLSKPREGGVTLMVGSEREGLPAELVGAADLTTHIPIQTDSLNAAMATAIALYELRSRMAPQ